jgi:hypothetical protein
MTKPIWTEGVCGDGVAILRDGVPVSISKILKALNDRERLYEFLSGREASTLPNRHTVEAGNDER